MTDSIRTDYDGTLKQSVIEIPLCCFYLNGNDREGHKKVLRYMLNNGLIRKTKSGRLYNISFKYDSQTYAGKYKGSGFTGEIKLADFVDLETGKFV